MVYPCTVFANPSKFGSGGWFSFIFVLVSIAAAVFFSCLQSPPTNDVGVTGIALYYSVGFVFVSVLINALFIFLAAVPAKMEASKALEVFGKLIVAADVIILIVYLGIMLFFSYFMERHSNAVKEVRTQVKYSSFVSSSLGDILSLAEDKEIHQALLKMKEKVDYSTNTSNTDYLNNEISDQLTVIRRLVCENGSKEEALRQIRELGVLWSRKNAAR